VLRLTVVDGRGEDSSSTILILILILILVVAICVVVDAGRCCYLDSRAEPS